MKSKVIGILLIICLIAPFAVTNSYLHFRKKLVKKEVKRKIVRGLDKKELVLLKFEKKETKSKLKWKHSKEFEFRGHMYDIVETELKNDSIYYWCWWDKKETKLNKQLTRLLELKFGKDPKKNETQSRLSNYLKSLYSYKFEKRSSVYMVKEIVNCFYINNYMSLYLPTNIPPPRVT